MNPAAMLAELEAERSRIDTAIAALRPLVHGPAPAAGAAAPAPKGKKPKAWKHRRRCPSCEQLTQTDPCQHCGTPIAPAGARDLKL